jgi:phage tail tape-measure protein
MADERIVRGQTDTEKGEELGGVGGAVTGAVAGAAAGPVGAVAGAVIGGVVGAAASGAAVHEVDKVDDDNTLTGVSGHAVRRAEANTAHAVTHPEGDIPGIQTGGHAIDGTPDTRGVTEKVADALTGDHIDDKTGKRV